MSSRKQGRGRSSSKSSSKSKRSDAYGPAKSEVTKGRFFPMTLGMTVSLMLILWIISFFTTTAKKKTSKPKDRQSDAAIAMIESTSFGQIISSGDPDKILAKLNELNQSKSLDVSPVGVRENEQRIKLSRRLLELNAAQSYKKFAKLNWLEAQRSNYGIDFIGKLKSPKIAAEFEDCLTRFLNDTDPDVYREAHLAQLSLVLFECIKGNRTSDDVSKHLNAVLEKFPNEDRVASAIRVQFSAAVEADINLAKQMAENVLRNESIQGGQAAGFMQFVLDRYELLKVNYNELFINRFVNGDVGLRELEKASTQLLSNPESGTLVVDKVAQIARWFERRRSFEHAKKIYQAMLDAGNEDRAVAEAKEMLIENGNAGLTRMELFGQEIVVAGTTAAGKKIEPGYFKKRIVLILFFTPNEPNSMKLVNNLQRSAKQYSEFGSPVRVVAVAANDDGFENALNAKFSESRVHFLGWNDGQPPDLLKTFPVISFPRLIALDNEGKLVRLNIDPNRYELDVELLVDQR